MTFLRAYFWYFLYPIIFALDSVLIYYHNNIAESIYTDLFQTLILVLLFTLLVNFLTFISLKDTFKSFTVLFVIYFYLFYFSILDLLASKIGQPNLVLFIFAAVFFFLLIKIFKKGVSEFTVKTLTVLTLSIFVYNFLSITFFESKVYLANKKTMTALPQIEVAKSSPSIYYLVFDRYANSKMLSSLYGYDNSNFLTFLHNKKFFIAAESSTNYNNTVQSIATEINLDYLENLIKENSKLANLGERMFSNLMGESKISKVLLKNGYRYYYLGGRWSYSRAVNKKYNYTFNGDYDRKFSFLNFLAPTFFTENYFSQTTLLTFFAQKGSSSDYHSLHALYQLKKTKQIAKNNGKEKKFVFVHFLLPHKPFVFKADCSLNKDLKVNVKRYTDQLSCANKIIKDLVNTILQNDKNSVIIIQSDEGPNPLLADYRKNGWDDKNVLKEKMPNFISIYYPSRRYKSYYDTLTPINVFRFILNDYFSANLNKLPDKNYVIKDKYKGNYNAVDTEDFLDVTSQVKKIIKDFQ